MAKWQLIGHLPIFKLDIFLHKVLQFSSRQGRLFFPLSTKQQQPWTAVWTLWGSRYGERGTKWIRGTGEREVFRLRILLFIHVGAIFFSSMIILVRSNIPCNNSFFSMIKKHSWIFLFVQGTPYSHAEKTLLYYTLDTDD